MATEPVQDVDDQACHLIVGRIRFHHFNDGRNCTSRLVGTSTFTNCRGRVSRRAGGAFGHGDCHRRRQYLVRIDKQSMLRLLHDDRTFSALFLAYMLARNVRIQEDLVDQLFNFSEKRLARILLLMAHFGKEGNPEVVIPTISQETLAEMIGATRSCVSFFINRFKKMGLIHYDSGLHVHSCLFNVILHD